MSKTKNPPTTQQRRELASRWLLAATSQDAIRDVQKLQADNSASGEASTVERVQAELTEVLNTFQQFESKWERMLDSSPRQSIDAVLAVHVRRIAEAMKWELHALAESMTCVVASERERDAAASEPPEPPAAGGAATALANVMTFVRDVRELQHRAWLYALAYAAQASEQEIMHPFDRVIEAALGKIASAYIEPTNMGDADNVAATEILAGKRTAVPARGEKHAG